VTRIALPPVGGSMGEKLREARLKKGWGQVETAARAQELMPENGARITQGLFSAYELDKRVFPDRAIVAALAQVLDLDADDLLLRTGWGRGREQMSGYPKNDTIFINAPSPTMTELLRVIDRLDQDQLERVLAYARGLQARR
jgi:transcriptional regulator with XRE-family HTH domain